FYSKRGGTTETERQAFISSLTDGRDASDLGWTTHTLPRRAGQMPSDDTLWEWQWSVSTVDKRNALMRRARRMHDRGVSHHVIAGQLGPWASRWVTAWSQPLAFQAVTRTSPRPRGAGRPRARRVSSAARSGDSGDDGP